MIKIELHAHTSETSLCGKLSATELIDMYAAAGYSVVVITDHLWDGWKAYKPIKRRVLDYLSGYCAAKAHAEQYGMHVLLGVELRLEHLGSEDFLMFGPAQADIADVMRILNRARSVEELRRKVNEMECLFIQAHPYRRGLRAMPLEFLDGIEVYNGNPRHLSGNDKALLYAQSGDMIMTSGSDAHQPEDVGRGGIYGPEWVTDNASLVRFLRETKHPQRIETKDII